MNENVFVFTNRRTHRTMHIYAPWTVRTFNTFIFTFLHDNYQSRLQLCMYATHVLLFFYHLFRLNLLREKNYINTRQLRSSNHTFCWMFLLFVSSRLFRSFAAFSCFFLLLFCMCTLTAIQSILFILLSSELETSQLHAGLLPNRNITYVFVVMGKSMCACYGKIYVFIWQSFT